MINYIDRNARSYVQIHVIYAADTSKSMFCENRLNVKLHYTVAKISALIMAKSKW